MEIINIENKIEAKIRIDKFLAENTDLSRSRIASLILEGNLKVNGVVVIDLSYKARPNEKYELLIPDAVDDESVEPQDIKLDIIYEDDCLIVLNKEAGMVVHPAAGNWQGTLVNALLFHAKGELSGIGGVKRPGIVHRLDKDTSGILLVAKDDFTHAFLSQQFAGREVKKEYIAVVKGILKPSKGMIDTNIGRSLRNRQKQAVLTRGGKNAVTEYETEKVYNDGEYSLVKVRIHTGRTHQIRVHMAHIGNPILGDEVYGRKNDKLIKRQALHAFKVEFVHPKTRKTMEFKANIPEDIKKLL